MTNFNISNQAFNNALNRVSNLTDEQSIAHGVVEQLLHKNLNRLYLVQDKLINKDGKPNALSKKINQYLKHLGFKYSKNKEGKIKVKQWIESDNPINFLWFLSIEKGTKEVAKNTASLESRLETMLTKALKDNDLQTVLASIEAAKSALIAAAAEMVKADKAVEFDIQCSDLEGNKKTKAA